MKIEKNITTFATLIALVAGTLGGVLKGIEEFEYKFLNKAHSENEIYMRHLISDHIMAEEKSEKSTINTKEGYAEISKFTDDCIAIKRKSEYGDVISVMVLPSPDKTKKIKEIYSSNDGIAYADGVKFNFKVHLKDFNCKEVINENTVKRTYGDGCCLQYRYDTKTGLTVDWVWVIYKH